MPCEKLEAKHKDETAEQYETRKKTFLEKVALNEARLLYGRIVTSREINGEQS